MLSPMQTHVRTHYDRALRGGNRDELLVAAAVAADVADCVVCQVDEYVTLTQYALKMRVFSLRTILKEANIRPPSPNVVGPGDKCARGRCTHRRAPASRFCEKHTKELPVSTDEMSFTEKEKISHHAFEQFTGWRVRVDLFRGQMVSTWADGRRRKVDADGSRTAVFALDHILRANTQDGTQALLVAPYGFPPGHHGEADLDHWCAERGLRWFRLPVSFYPMEPNDPIGIVPVDWPGPDWAGATHKSVGVLVR